MFYWILTIFKLQDKLKHYAEKIDKDAMNEALNIAGDTVRAYDNILKLNEKKVSVINLKVMADNMKRLLSPTEFFVINSYANGATIEELAKTLGQLRGTTYKLVKKIANRCEAVLANLKISLEYLEKTYRHYAPVFKALAKVKKRKSLLTFDTDDKGMNLSKGETSSHFAQTPLA